MYKTILRSKLNDRHYNMLKRLYLNIRSIPYLNNLNKLALVYTCDKGGAHNYTAHYEKYFKKLKYRKIKLFEIGVGGYHYPNRGGNSLRMWKRYFPFAKIYSLDIYDKSFVEEKRIKIFKGSQTDEQLLTEIVKKTGSPDIIIDDGSHINEHVIKTFNILFPTLKDNGIYVVEDVMTSYWPDYGGNSNELNNGTTIMSYFKNLADGINHQDIIRNNYQPSHFDLKICSIHFYHNLIFIFKGSNNEASGIDPKNPESIMADKIYI